MSQNAGYVWTELGPQGFLPQDPQQLRDELDQRGLKVCGGTVFAGLHKGKEALDKAIADFSREAKLLTEVGAKYLIQLPEQYTDMHTGKRESADMDPQQWSNLVSGTNELGRVIYEEFGVHLVFHPHADTHVDTQDRIEQFLKDTDPQFVNLCLDTGHSPIAAATTCRSSSSSRNGSPTCISSWSIRRSGNGFGGRSSRSPRRFRWASWSSRRTGSRRFRRCWTHWSDWTGTSSLSSSRTCIRSPRTSRWGSRPGRRGISPHWGSDRSGAGRTDRGPDARARRRSASADRAALLPGARGRRIGER